MKILYEQSTFYLLQDWPSEPPMQYDPHEMYSQHAWGDYYQLCEQSKSKKIKIANPDLLYPLTKHKINASYGEWLSNFQDNDTFDLPKELSVEIKYGCQKCGAHYSESPIECRNGYCERDEVAILSKSSSPEIPDSSEEKEPKDFWKGAVYHIDGAEYNVDEEKLAAAFHKFADFKKFSIYPPSPPTVAGTSTEPIPDKLEKPDFHTMLNSIRNNYAMFYYGDVIELIDKIYNDYVIPRDKTISDLRERVKGSWRKM